MQLMNLATTFSLVGMLSAAATAQPNLIDFELIPGMTNSPGAAIPEASRLSDQYLSMGVRFSTQNGSPFVATVIHGAGTPSGTRIIGGATVAGQLTYNQQFPLLATFFNPSGLRPMVASFVTIRGDLFPIPGTKTIEAFDLAGNTIASQTLQDSDSAPLSVAIHGIHGIRVYSSSATVGFDDLRFDDLVPACAADFNNDGAVDFFDYLDFVDALSSNAPSSDFNHDGISDFFDYLDFVDAFSQGC